MSPALRLFLRELLAELREFGAPLERAVADPPALRRLLASLGWSFEGLLHAELDPATQAVRALLDDLRALAEGLVPAPPGFQAPSLAGLEPSPEALAAAAAALARAAGVAAAQTAQEALAQAAAALGRAAARIRDAARELLFASVPATREAAGEQGQAVAAAAVQLGADLLDFLLRDWLRRRWPVGFALCEVVGLVTEEEQAEIALQLGERRAVVRSKLRRTRGRLVELPSLAGALLGQALGRAGGARGATAGPVLPSLPADPLGGLARGLERLELALRALGVDDPRVEITPARLSLVGLLPGPPGEPLSVPFTLGGAALTLTGTTSGSTGTWSLSWLAAPPGEGGLRLPAPFGMEISAAGGGPSGGALPQVTLQRTGGLLGCTFSGGLLVTLPADLLCAAAGSARLSASAWATLQLALGEEPRLTLEQVRFAAADVRLGGPSGLLVSGAVTVEDLRLPWSDATLPRLTVEGTCDLAGASSSARVAVRAVAGPDGFLLQSTGALELGAIRLRPHPAPAGVAPAPPAPPVLELRVARGLDASAGLEARLDGAVELPGTGPDGAAVVVGLGGSLTAAVGPERASLRSLSARGGLVGASVLQLPGGLLLEALAASLDWRAPEAAAPAPELEVALAGRARVGEGAGPVQGSAAFAGAVRWNPLTGQAAVKGAVTLDGLSVSRDLVVVKASLGLEASPTACSLTLAGGQLGLLAMRAGARAEGDFHLFAKDVRGACVVGADARFALSLEGTVLLPEALGAGTAPAAALDARLTGTLRPLSLRLDAGAPDPRWPGLAGARLTLDSLALGGATLKPAALAVQGVALPVRPEAQVALGLEGRLLLPGAGSVAVQGSLAVAGEPPALQARLRSEAEVALPGGLRLLQVVDPVAQRLPTLEASLALGGASASAARFALNGRLRVPQEGGEKDLDLQGSLELGQKDGAPCLKSLAARTVSESTWVVPGGVELKEFGAELKVEAAPEAAEVYAALWGKLKDPRLSGGAAAFTGQARGGGAGLAVSGQLTVDDATFGGGDGAADLCLAHAEVGVTVTSGPRCRLDLSKGLIGFKPRANPASPKTAADFDLALADLAASLEVTDQRASAALAGALLLPEDAFSSDEGRARIALSGATLSATRAPPSLALGSAQLDLANVRIGGRDGLVLKRGRLRLQDFALPPERAAGPWAVAVDGAIDFPGGGEVALSGGLTAGRFQLASTVDLALGGGVVIHAPPAGRPTLALDVRAGSGQAQVHFELAGGVEFPGGPVGPAQGEDGVIPPSQRIDVAGSVDLTASAQGVTLQRFEARGGSPSVWRLPGGLRLSGLSAEVLHSPERTRLGASGRLELGSGVTLQKSDPGAAVTLAAWVERTRRAGGDNLHLHGALEDVHLSVAGHLRVFGGALAVDVDTAPLQAALAVTGASAGLFLKEGRPGTALSDYHFAIEDLTGTLLLDRGFRLQLTRGTLHLPAAYLTAGGGDEGAGATLPQVSIAEVPLTLAFDQERGLLDVDGSFLLAGGAVSAGAGDAPRASLDSAHLVFAARGLPMRAGVSAGGLGAWVHLDHVSGKVHLPLPNGEGVDLAFEDGTWDAHGFPLGTVGVEKDIRIKFGGGEGGDDANAFVLVFPGKRPGAAGFVNSLTISPRPGEGGYHDLRINGAVGLQVPLSLISHSDPGQQGQNLYAEAEGSIGFSDAPDAEVTLRVSHLEFGGSFRLGSDTGLVVEEARLVADHLDRLFARSVDAQNPFTLTLTGKIGVDISGKEGPSLGVKDARFTFKTLDLTSLAALPEFEIKEFDFDQGEALRELPIAIRHATFTFKDPHRPLYSTSAPRLLDPDNLELGCSLEAKLPFGDGAGAMARADGIKASISDGKLHFSLSGVGFGIDGLEVGPVGCSGALYLGGLDSNPFKPFFAGKVGGEFDGTGLTVLLACEVDKPLGASLSVEGGAVGIPLGPTGFLLTGASGGVSFLNTPIDPSDLSKYIAINEPLADGSPPAAPTRAKGADGKEVEFPAEPPPPDPGKKQGPPADASGGGASAKGGAAPAGQGAPAEGGGKRPLPTVRPDGLARDGCPGECPPPSMNILCQPHPDQANYPGRAIFKFSALDESFLLRIVPAATVQRLKAVTKPDASTVEEIAGYVEAGLRQISRFDRLPAQPAQIRKAANDALLLARSAFSTALKKAFLTYPAQNAWEVLRATAWAGVPCHDETFQVTGQLSYAGVSAVATIEGGVNISTTGNAGVIGNLNLFGMKVGRLRGFITVTDDQGVPDPSLCADLEVVIGPLEVAQVKFLYKYGINVGELARAVAGELAPYAERLLKPLLLQVVGPALRRELGMPADGSADFDAERALGLLAARAADAAQGRHGGLQQLLALFERILNGGFIALRNNPASSPQEIARLVYRLVDVVWAAYQPTIKFCAVAEVKLFGFSLGKLVEVQGNAGKDHLFVKLSATADAVSYQVSAYFTFPDFYALVIESVGMLLELEDPAPAKLKEKLEQIATTLATRTLAQMAHNAVIVASATLSPLGFTLGQLALRVLLPNLTRYPGADWQPLASPSRVEVLTATVRDGVLAKDHWRGMPDEMATLRLPEGKSAAGTHLIDSFFPHGGLIGAGFLKVPSFFTEPPPVQEFLTALDGHKDLPARGQAALKLVAKLTAGMTDLGALTLYLPPPALPKDQLDQLREHPEKLLDALRALQFPSGRQPLVELFNRSLNDSLSTAKLCFCKGHLKGRLFGIDFLEADAEFVPAGAPDAGGPVSKPSPGPGPAAGRQPTAFAKRGADVLAVKNPGRGKGPPGKDPTAAVAVGDAGPAQRAAPAGPPSESILKISVNATSGAGVIGQLVPAGAQLEILVRGQPPQAILKTFQELQAGLRGAVAPGKEPLLAALLTRLAGSLERDLPKAMLKSKVDVELKLPPALRPYLALQEHVALYAYTPGFSASEDGTPEGRARRRGGVGFRGLLRLGLCGLAFEERLELVLEVDKQDQPRVRGELAAAVGAPGGFAGLAASFDSSPEPGQDWVKVRGEAHLGAFDLGPWRADVLGVQQEIFPRRSVPGGAQCSFVLRAGPGGLSGSFDAQASLDPGHPLRLANLSFDLGPAERERSAVKLLEAMAQALSERLFAEVQKGVAAEVNRLTQEANRLAGEVKKALEGAKAAAEGLRQELDKLTPAANQAVTELKKAQQAAEAAYNEAVKLIPGTQR